VRSSASIGVRISAAIGVTNLGRTCQIRIPSPESEGRRFDPAPAANYSDNHPGVAEVSSSGELRKVLVKDTQGARADRSGCDNTERAQAGGADGVGDALH
jgi:hypothetical protein